MLQNCKGYGQSKGEKSAKNYQNWKVKHQPHCVKNHSGSSSEMEVDVMQLIYERSAVSAKCKVCEIYLGWGHKNISSASKFCDISHRKSRMRWTHSKADGDQIAETEIVESGRNVVRWQRSGWKKYIN